jgi:hypothetical protein
VTSFGSSVDPIWGCSTYLRVWLSAGKGNLALIRSVPGVRREDMLTFLLVYQEMHVGVD